MFTIRDSDAAKIRKAAEVFKRVREEMGLKLPKDGANVRFTGLQSGVHDGQSHTNPMDIGLGGEGIGSAAAFGHKAEDMQREG